MNEFLLVFRTDFISKEEQPSPEQLQASIKPWQDWFGGIAAQDKLARPLQRWDGRRLRRSRTNCKRLSDTSAVWKC